MSTQKELDVKKMEATDVKSNPNDVLGLQYNKYKNSLYASSLSKPSEYFKLRGDLEDTLKTELVSNMFTTIYELLRYGTIKGTNVVGVDDNGSERIPGYPSANVNALSQKITKTFDDFMDEIINILMPPSYMELAKNKTIVKAEAIGL